MNHAWFGYVDILCYNPSRVFTERDAFSALLATISLRVSSAHTREYLVLLLYPSITCTYVLNIHWKWWRMMKLTDMNMDGWIQASTLALYLHKAHTFWMYIAQCMQQSLNECPLRPSALDDLSTCFSLKCNILNDHLLTRAVSKEDIKVCTTMHCACHVISYFCHRCLHVPIEISEHCKACKMSNWGSLGKCFWHNP